ncbi:response regulator [Thermodesulfobacteriota bacterium]
MDEYEILLVDDEPNMLKLVGPALEHEGFRVTTSDNGQEAIDLITKKDFDLIITDMVMEPVDGISVLKRAKELDPETVVIILTGYGDTRSVIDALRLNADDYLLKPCDPAEIYFRISKSLEKLELKRRLKTFEDVLDICPECKMIRDNPAEEDGDERWVPIEDYIRKRTMLEATAAYCPKCSKKAQETLFAN